MADEIKIGLLKTCWLLRDYLQEIVIGGGWVPMLYYHYVLGEKDREPIRTRDIDILIKEKVPVRGRQTIDQLLTDAGLSSKLTGRGERPARHYEGEIDGVEVEIEFLTHQRGPKDDEIVTVQENLTAQALRFTAVSIENTMEVVIDDFLVGSEPKPLRIRIPTPWAFIFHKGLIFTRRSQKPKMAKDLYYIFDILANLDVMKDQIYAGMAELKRGYTPWFKSFTKNMESYFAGSNDAGVLMVLSQRPSNAFPGLNDDQFKQYVYAVFKEFIGEIKAL